MNFLLTLLILIIILGIIIFIHELGHFIAAKKAGVYVEEFALGMGPKLFKFKRKNDPTTYSIRAFPIGGFVSMAGEDEVKTKVRDDQVLTNKSFIKQFLVMVMGVTCNFVLTFFLLLLNALIFGSTQEDSVIGYVEKDSAAYNAGIRENDEILQINNHTVESWEDIIIELNLKNDFKEYVFEIKTENKEIKTLNITPTLEKKDGEETYVFGIGSPVYEKNYGFVSSIKYTFNEFGNILSSLVKVLGYLFTGKLSLDNLSGPVGIYSAVDTLKTSGIESLIYLTAYLSLNVAVMNLIPIPVFDGGRILFLAIEKLTKKKIPEKVNNIINTTAFILLIILMIYVTFNDILRLF